MKRLSILLVLLMSINLLAGCSSQPSTPEAPAEVDGGNQEVIEMTLAHSTAESTSMHYGQVKMKEYLEEKAPGRFNINIYPNAQLGGDREIIEGVQSGSITMIGSSTAPQVNFVSSAVIFDLPFIYENVEVARKVLVDPDFRAALEVEYEKAGLKWMGASDQGFRTLTANKIVKSPADLAGMTIRTMENKYHMAAWQELGANPTPLAFNELYTALQQGTVDAQENPIELIHSQKFYEQQDYVILTNHIMQTIGWVMSLDFYNSLPEDMQNLVSEAATYGIEEAIKFQDENVGKFRQEIEEYGTEFIELSAEELAPFSERAKNMWGLVEENTEPAVYEALMNALNK